MRFVVLLAALLTAHQASAQNETFLDDPVALWSVNDGVTAGIGEGNECALNPGFDPVLICTLYNGAVVGRMPSDGSQAWFYSGQSDESKSSSGVTFIANGTQFVYASTESASCMVHLISTSTGVSISKSTLLKGICSGTPIISSDDAYVFLTHNVLNGVAGTGTFTVLNTNDLSIMYNFTDKSQHLSPPGIFFTPFQGNYANGVGNNNDLVIFGNRPLPEATEVTNSSALFAFQLPMGDAKPSVTELLKDTDFQGTTAPLITNGGNSMFWGVSRSNVVGWAETSFDREPGGYNIGFNRGEPRSRPIMAELAMGSDDVTPTLFTGTAGQGFAAISTTKEELTELWTVNTTFPVFSQAKVAQKGSKEMVIFADSVGMMYAVTASKGEIVWQNLTTIQVYGNFALSAANDTIYFGDFQGNIRAWKVATYAPATPPPTAAPVPPTAAPVEETVAPTMKELSSSAPTSGTAPTNAPMASMTTDPTMVATEAPTSSQQTTPSPTTSGIPVATKIGAFLAASFAFSFLVL